MEKNCNEEEGVRLLETMRKICNTKGCEEVENATLAYEKALQKEVIQLVQENLDKQAIGHRIV